MRESSLLIISLNEAEQWFPAQGCCGDSRTSSARKDVSYHLSSMILNLLKVHRDMAGWWQINYEHGKVSTVIRRGKSQFLILLIKSLMFSSRLLFFFKGHPLNSTEDIGKIFFCLWSAPIWSSNELFDSFFKNEQKMKCKLNNPSLPKRYVY